jgi:hypothetical protein
MNSAVSSKSYGVPLSRHAGRMSSSGNTGTVATRKSHHPWSAFSGVNSLTANPFCLKRIPIGDWFATPDQFGFEFLAGLWRRDGFWMDSDFARAAI